MARVSRPIGLQVRDGDVRHFRLGSGPAQPSRPRGGRLPGVEQTEPDESGPSAAELLVSGT